MVTEEEKRLEKRIRERFVKAFATYGLLSDGDRVLVQHTKDLQEGEIGIFLVDNEGYIKEYRKDGLHSHNPEYRTMTFHEDQSVRCIGRVIGKLKDEQIPSREIMNRITEAEQAGKETI